MINVFGFSGLSLFSAGVFLQFGLSWTAMFLGGAFLTISFLLARAN